MLFNSLQFIFIFLPIFLLIYYLAPGRFRNLILLLGSFVFYAVGVFSHPLYILLLLASVAVNYALGLALGETQSKPALVGGLVYNLGWLFVFKYTNFFFGSLIGTVSWALPLGISFYTFQAISYLVDVYRGTVPAEKSILDFGTYLVMFPHVLSGPIDRYKDMKKHLARRRVDVVMLAEGLKTFICGLGLKVLLANRLGGLWMGLKGIGYDAVSTPLAWCGIVAYSLQLYFDFYGYSLMAMGIGRMLGFKIADNFNHPYISVSMTEFWRRWHMTLGSWFKDYLYIPLGGNRVAKSRMYLNLLIVWMATGLWHGASWNFVLWGFLTFVLIAIEKAGFLQFVENHRVVGHIYMIVVIPLMWAVFANTDFHQMGLFLTRLVPIHFDMMADFLRYFKDYWIYLAAGILFSTPVPSRIYKRLKNNIFGYLLLVAVFAFSVYGIYMGGNDPFLYFQF